MSRKAIVWYKQLRAGLLEELPDSYRFSYLPEYLAHPDAKPISVTLPLATPVVQTRQLHPFFDGLIPEGWLLAVAQETWKLSRLDRMGALLAACRDCIGAVGIEDCSDPEPETV